MSDQPEAQAPPAAAAPAQNGIPPTPPEPPGSLDLGREIRLVARALEDIDMRLQSVQVGVMMICGLALLTLALELRRLKQ